MDAVMMHGSFDIDHKSNLKNPQKFHQNPIISNSNPSDAFRLSRFNSAGLLRPPPPPFLRRQSSQPPLLPLPTAVQKPRNPNKSKSPKKQGKNSPKKSKDAAPPLISFDARKCEIGGGLTSAAAAEVGDQAGIFSSSAVFTFSPPPSSLPLPSFSLRPRLGCKAAAGATDDLRRLLRLQ
ncbi:uncharacterized protein LOC125221496 [Salvia hispanica]|uniref:uncharacterized protein LOC125221496 n=1 Tax=Salvia hispanica TaxID=49212 RepID=UPI00200967E4|nr:uncharacterized protein LOC125221496 [Salvia hispanica]